MPACRNDEVIGSVQSLLPDQGPGRHPPPGQGDAGHDRQPARPPRGLPRHPCPGGAHGGGRHARAGHDALGPAVAGLWTNWTSTRKVKEGEVSADLFAFLTTEANGVVGPIHPKAMPVILTSEDEIEAWMSAPPQEALRLQRPLPDDALRIVARGERSDDIAA